MYMSVNKSLFSWKGSKKQTVGITGSSFDLDATSSEDPDALAGTLEYEWTCEAEESDVSQEW